MTCGFTVNLQTWMLLGACTWRQSEVAQKQKWRQVLWQGPGPGLKGDPRGTSTLLFDPCPSPLLFYVFPSASVAKVAVPALDIRFFQ